MEGIASDDEVGKTIDAYRQALPAFLAGDPAPVVRLYSTRDDVTLANPLGPPRRGSADVEEAIQVASSHFRGGSVCFEEISRVVTPQLAYVVQLEHNEATVVGRDGVVAMPLRVTMIFRREAEGWKVVHRHADPITTGRSIASTFVD